MNRVLGVAALVVFALLIGCVHTKAKKSGKQAAGGAQLIDIALSSKGNDIAFSVSALQVPYGKDIVLEFKNEATKESEILHNIAVLKPKSTEKVIEFFEESDYDPEKIKKHPDVLAITPSLPPGETSQLKLTKEMLSKPGFYPYICLMPGHADVLGMTGTLHVK